jgi:hypothetical protein
LNSKEPRVALGTRPGPWPETTINLTGETAMAGTKTVPHAPADIVHLADHLANQPDYITLRGLADLISGKCGSRPMPHHDDLRAQPRKREKEEIGRIFG